MMGVPLDFSLRMEPESQMHHVRVEVVSDFDTFTVGSMNMVYESLPAEQALEGAWCS